MKTFFGLQRFFQRKIGQPFGTRKSFYLDTIKKWHAVLKRLPAPVLEDLVYQCALITCISCALKGIVENKPASLFVLPFGKALKGIAHFDVVDRWLAILKLTRYSAPGAMLIFSVSSQF